MTEDGIPGCIDGALLPQSVDYLATTLAVLKVLTNDRSGHTTKSVELAQGVYWNDPVSSFAPCDCAEDQSKRCTNLISKFESTPKVDKDESTSESHAIFDQYRKGAVIIGQPTGRLVKWSTRIPVPRTSAVGVKVQQPYGAAVRGASASSVSYETAISPISATSIDPAVATLYQPSKQKQSAQVETIHPQLARHLPLLPPDPPHVLHAQGRKRKG